MDELIAGRYRLDDPIGNGGMAEVWRSTDTRSGAIVAVKRLHPGLAGDPTARARFRREVAAARSITHPGAVRVLDADADAEVPWLVMEHVSGGTLADRLRDGAVDPGVALRIAADVASALSALHAAGIVHRDVTPSNILLPAVGGARLADFGIARPWEAAAEDVTLTGDLVGTMRFVAPEVLAGRPATPAADVWALGAVLQESLTGTRTFDASSPAALLESQRIPPPAPAAAGPGVAGLLAGMLDPDPHRRPTAAEVADLLRAAVAQEADDDSTAVVPSGTVAFAAALSSRAVATEDAPAALPRDPEDIAASHVDRLTPAARPARSSRPARATSRAVLLGATLLLGAAVLAGAALGNRSNPTTTQTTSAPVAGTPTPTRPPVATDRPPGADGGATGGGGNGGGSGKGKGHGNGNGKDKGKGG